MSGDVDVERSIFITGAASGIGRATTELFAARGWFVGATDLDEGELVSLAALLGDRCSTAVLDVTDKDAFDVVIADFGAATGGRLDLLFNNAGITFGGWFEDVPFEHTVKTVEVNLLGVLNGTHAAMPLLKATPGSLCMTTSSSAATFGAPGMATYAATKAAVKGFTEAMSVELGRHGSRAADVSPGIIDTAIWQSPRYVDGEAVADYTGVPARNAARTDASRTLPPLAVAECVWDAYHGDGLHYYVPPEVFERERAKIDAPEALRDQLIEQWR